jgi:hypothetical protein
MRPHRPQTWTVEEQEDGTFDVRRGNRPVTTGLHSRVHAESTVRVSRQPGEKVWHVAPDGYRTDWSRRFPDPQPPHRRAAPPPEEAPDPHPVRTRYLMRYRRA